MTHLLAIAVGPVQEFIAAARRTRDLWFGSYLLSEISRAVAGAVEKSGGQLIFPAELNAENVANIILAELPAGEPREVAAKAKEAAANCWKKFADGAYAEASSHAHQKTSGVLRVDVWKSQVDDVIEFYAAWVEKTGDYICARQRVMRLLAGRKNLRDFQAAKGLDVGLPKSSLDGQRETVLNPHSEWQKRFRATLRIREGEQLDVVGMVKRLGLGTVNYPSVSRVAADPWVRGNAKKLDEITAACKELGNRVIREINIHKHTHYEQFPYEGTAVYISRHYELIEETEVTKEQLKPLRDALAKLPEPNPYLAVLVADGDKIGATLSYLTTADSHRQFSKDLAGFASGAESIVHQHHGVLIYAGGDDVLAFVPVDKCLDCAGKLHDDFGKKLEKYQSKPTLSVGIAIGHFMDNLEDLLEYGRDAEKAAKKVEGKNALAVHLHKRGGSPTQVQSQWTDGIDTRLQRYAELILREAIPGKLPYDLRKLADVYQKWPADTLIQALRADVLRVIRDKQPKSGRMYMAEIEELVHTRLTDAVSLHRFSEELLVAKQIATAMSQAGGKL